MLCVQSKPNPFLEKYISAIWYFEHYFDEEFDMIFLPKNTHFITISFDDLAKLKFLNAESKVVDPLTFGGLLDKTSLNIILKGKVRFIGIDFKPYGIFKLTNQSAEIFVNNNWDMSLFFSKSLLYDLYEQLLEHYDYNKYFDLIQSFLTHQFQRKTDERKDRSIAKVSDAIGLMSDLHMYKIENVASELAMSGRNFHRLFTTVVGVSPKSWLDKHRFQEIITGIKSNKWKSLEETAYRNGFNDISHFCKFFKAQSGYKPSEVLSQYDPMYNAIFQYEG